MLLNHFRLSDNSKSIYAHLWISRVWLRPSKLQDPSCGTHHDSNFIMKFWKVSLTCNWMTTHSIIVLGKPRVAQIIWRCMYRALYCNVLMWRGVYRASYCSVLMWRVYRASYCSVLMWRCVYRASYFIVLMWCCVYRASYRNVLMWSGVYRASYCSVLMWRCVYRPQGRSGRVQKNSPPPGFDPRTVQPVASRYTDWAIPAPQVTWYLLKLFFFTWS
jgi:hypothetical protein